MLKISIIVSGFEPQKSMIFDPFFEVFYTLCVAI